jgi:hypothetical protein
MNAVDVQVEINKRQMAFMPGDVLNATYRLISDDMPDIQGVELSVLWTTQGKGDTDMGIHFFERVTPDDGWDPAAVHRLSTRLPRSPLSFDGLIIKIGWCVRVRVLVRGRKEFVGQASFRLGAVPPPQEVKSSH